jgi:magnesium chelatase subunit I
MKSSLVSVICIRFWLPPAVKRNGIRRRRQKEDDLVEKLLNRSIVKVFDQYFSLNSLQKVVEYFNSGWGVEVSDQMASQDYLQDIKEIPGLKEAIRSLGIQDSPSLMASATEFVLEGLHLHQKLNKEIEGGRVTYGNK